MKLLIQMIFQKKYKSIYKTGKAEEIKLFNKRLAVITYGINSSRSVKELQSVDPPSLFVVHALWDPLVMEETWRFRGFW